MFQIPLYFLLILYVFFFLVFVIFMLVNFTHLEHMASVTPASKIITVMVLALSMAVILGTLILLININWTHAMFQTVGGNTLQVPIFNQ